MPTILRRNNGNKRIPTIPELREKKGDGKMKIYGNNTISNHKGHENEILCTKMDNIDGKQIECTNC